MFSGIRYICLISYIYPTFNSFLVKVLLTTHIWTHISFSRVRVFHIIYLYCVSADITCMNTSPWGLLLQGSNALRFSSFPNQVKQGLKYHMRWVETNVWDPMGQTVKDQQEFGTPYLHPNCKPLMVWVTFLYLSNI